eukprot:763466-Hanusia_phi.AAC.2
MQLRHDAQGGCGALRKESAERCCRCPNPPPPPPPPDLLFLLSVPFLPHLLGTGDYHAAAVTADGKLYTWGYGRSGQLGNGNTVDVSLPVLVRELQNLRVQSVACGCDHTVAVSAEELEKPLMPLRP